MSDYSLLKDSAPWGQLLAFD